MARPKIVTALTNENKNKQAHINQKKSDQLNENKLNDVTSELYSEESDRYIQTLEDRLIDQEEEINQLKLHATEMKLKNEQLLTVISEKDKFFTIIAHDLRNPLQTLKGFIQILYEEQEKLTVNEISEIISHIRSSIINYSDLLENLMLWARLQRGLTHFIQEIVPLLPVIKESVALLSVSARNKGIELTYSIPDNLKVLADVNILHTVIRNIISNALKFTTSGGKISLSAVTKDNITAEISISDTGIGMSPEMIKDLFKLDTVTSRTGFGGETGTGLGLIICKDFIENQGGKLWVRSEVSKGSVFSFSLPMNRSK